MPSAPELRLHQELLLMALDDEKGTIRASNYKFALSAGLLGELLLEDRVILEQGSKPSKDRIIPANPKLLSDPLLDECLRKVHGSKKPRSPKHWIAKLSQTSGLRKRVATGLVRRGVLRERNTRILFLIPWTVYPALDPAPKRRLVERVRAAVLGDSEIDDRTAIAVAVAASTGILKPVLGKQVLKDRKDRIEQITESQFIAAAVKAAADEAAAAAAVGAGG
jgi:hypothetical protein